MDRGPAADGGRAARNRHPVARRVRPGRLLLLEAIQDKIHRASHGFHGQGRILVQFDTELGLERRHQLDRLGAFRAQVEDEMAVGLNHVLLDVQHPADDLDYPPLDFVLLHHALHRIRTSATAQPVPAGPTMNGLMSSSAMPGKSAANCPRRIRQSPIAARSARGRPRKPASSR